MKFRLPLALLLLVPSTACTIDASRDDERPSLENAQAVVFTDPAKAWQAQIDRHAAGMLQRAQQLSAAAARQSAIAALERPTFDALLAKDPVQASLYTQSTKDLWKIDSLADTYFADRKDTSLASLLTAQKDYVSRYPIGSWVATMPQGGQPLKPKIVEWTCPQKGVVQLCGRDIDLSQLPQTVDGQTFNSCEDVLAWSLTLDSRGGCDAWPEVPGVPGSGCQTRRVVTPFPARSSSPAGVRAVSSTTGSSVMANATHDDNHGWAEIGSSLSVPSWARRISVTTRLTRGRVYAYASGGRPSFSEATLELSASLGTSNSCSQRIAYAYASGGVFSSESANLPFGAATSTCTLNTAPGASPLVTFGLVASTSETQGSATATADAEYADVTFCP